jgi:hypothetical protein
MALKLGESRPTIVLEKETMARPDCAGWADHKWGENAAGGKSGVYRLSPIYAVC